MIALDEGYKPKATPFYEGNFYLRKGNIFLRSGLGDALALAAVREGAVDRAALRAPAGSLFCPCIAARRFAFAPVVRQSF